MQFLLSSLQTLPRLLYLHLFVSLFLFHLLLLSRMVLHSWLSLVSTCHRLLFPPALPLPSLLLAPSRSCPRLLDHPCRLSSKIKFLQSGLFTVVQSIYMCVVFSSSRSFISHLGSPICCFPFCRHPLLSFLSSPPLCECSLDASVTFVVIGEMCSICLLNLRRLFCFPCLI